MEATIAKRVGVALVAAVVVFFAGGGWLFSDEIREGALVAVPPGLPEYSIAVLAVDDDSVTLARDRTSSADLTADGVYGVEWPDGYGLLEEIDDLDGDRVERVYTHISGDRMDVGDRVAVDARAFPDDPQIAFDIPFEEITYTSELGENPAWFVAGSRPTWMIFVHGYNAPREDALRLLAPVIDRGFPALVVDYRNDPGAARGADGLRHYGQTEWRDVEAATAYALEQGATDVVLVGYSMGGALVASFLYESDLVSQVRGVVLDAPALDLGAVIDHGARDRTLPLVGLPLPAALTQVAKGIAGMRYGLDWGLLDYVDRADELSTPVLLFHGDADDTVPISTSEALAKARPDLVTFVRVADAGHVRSWNKDPERYELRVRDFLDRVTAGGS